MFRLQFEHAKRSFIASFTAFCVSLSAILLATVSPASAVALNVLWYNKNDLETPITEYNFGDVMVGTTAHAEFLLYITPFDEFLGDSASDPTTTGRHRTFSASARVRATGYRVIGADQRPIRFAPDSGRPAVRKRCWVKSGLMQCMLNYKL